MSSPSTDRAEDVRAFLQRMAGEIPAVSREPRVAVRRARRRLAVTVVSGVLAVSMLAWGAVAGVQALRGSNRTLPADTGPLIERERLTRFVLETSSAVRDAVPGSELGPRLGLFRSDGGWWSSLEIESHISVSAERLDRVGLRNAYATVFATRNFRRSSDPPGPWATLVSLAMRFDDAASARRGGAIVSDRGVWDEAQPVRLTLGQASGGIHGSLAGTPSAGVWWTRGSLLLFVGSQGVPAALTVDELSALARAMDLRVP